MKLHGWTIAGKSWTAFLGGILNILIFAITQFAFALPPQWVVIIQAIVTVLTAVGVYHAPYSPVGRASAPVTLLNSPTVGGPFTGSPWPTS